VKEGWLCPAQYVGKRMGAIIDNLTGESPKLEIPGAVRSAARLAIDSGRAQHYTPRAGLGPLREAIVAHLEDLDNGPLLLDELAMVSGGQTESLFLVVETLVAKGDLVIAIGDVPGTAEVAVALAGGTLRRILHHSSLERGRGSQNSDNPEPSPLALIIINNSGSSGPVWDLQALQELAAIASDMDAVVLVLEDGIELTAGSVGQISAASCSALRVRAVRVGGFLAWGLDPWKIGYIVGPASLVAPITNLKQGLSICAPALSQYAALAALRECSEWTTVARDELAARRTVAVRVLDGSLLRLEPVQSGWTCVGHCLPARDSPSLITFLRTQAKVLVDDATRTVGRGGVQITLCQPVAVLGSSLQRVRDSLERL